jgi:hypothetical protein
MDVGETADNAGGTVDGLVNKPQANDAANNTVSEISKALCFFVVRFCILIIEPSLVYNYHTVPIVTIQLPINQVRGEENPEWLSCDRVLKTKISHCGFIA